MKSVAVFGPGSYQYIAGGGSSYVTPNHRATILGGITAAAGNVKVTGIRSLDWQSQPLNKVPNLVPIEDLSATFYNNTDLSGEPALHRTDKAIDFDWKRGQPAPEIKTDHFSARWTGSIKPDAEGDYIFAIRSDDGSRVKLDGKTILDCWRDQAAQTEFTAVHLEANRGYQLEVDYYNIGGEDSIQFACFPKPPAITPEQRAIASAADAVVVCVHTNETEGSDRPYRLDADQEELIRNLAAINSNCIVVLEAGGNVGMDRWIDSAAALIDAWYPGQEGGQAIAAILFGDVNPSGHLPDTFEKQWADSPAFGHYPGEDGKADKVIYSEGIYVGYRWYDKKQIEPRFPFGFGLSYTTFKLSNLKSQSGDNQVMVSVDVTNTGSRAGAAVLQLYVRPPADEAVDRCRN